MFCEVFCKILLQKRGKTANHFCPVQFKNRVEWNAHCEYISNTPASIIAFSIGAFNYTITS